MNNQFDELAKAMAQSLTRRAALKRFGVGLGAFALAALGLANRANATVPGIPRRCLTDQDCPKGMRCVPEPGSTLSFCRKKGAIK